MSDLVSFADAMLVTTRALRPLLAAKGESALVDTVIPFAGPEGAPVGLPYVAVRLDGSTPEAGRTGAAETATVRVSVWADSEYESLRVARLCRAVLQAFPGDDLVRSFSPLAGPFPTSDPDSGLPLSSFTIAARLRPIILP